MLELASAEAPAGVACGLDEADSSERKCAVIESVVASRPALIAIAAAALGALAIVGLGILIKPQPASALPSFAMQTGQPCAACHTAFPELTPFGRLFKLSGYTAGGGLTNTQAPPLALMIQGPQFEHFQKNLDAPPTPSTSTNDNVVLSQLSLFYGGQIYDNLGAFIQGTYDGVGNSWSIDNTDIRYTRTMKAFGSDLIVGVDVNNNPTVQDVWNTTPAWGLPYISAATGPAFTPPGTMLEGGFAGGVAGAGVYAWWNNMVYAELTGYRTLSSSTQQALGLDPTSFPSIDGIAPYWRVAFAPTIGEHSFMIGAFGMYATEVPYASPGFGVDRILDIGFDAQYQFIHGKHAFEAKVSNIYETDQYNASYALQTTSNPTDNLDSFRASVDYVYDNTYSLTASYFDVSGSADANLYGPNSIANSPNGNGFLFDVAYLPFSHGMPGPFPWANARIGVSYTKYLTLYGGTANFDGAGHNASDNNTFLAYSWLMF
ncbi:MAG: cytochrome C [Methylovirgula sp.]|nr:cytochrome C [Methylovirgula sp.]